MYCFFLFCFFVFLFFFVCNTTEISIPHPYFVLENVNQTISVPCDCDCCGNDANDVEFFWNIASSRINKSMIWSNDNAKEKFHNNHTELLVNETRSGGCCNALNITLKSSTRKDLIIIISCSIKLNKMCPKHHPRFSAVVHIKPHNVDLTTCTTTSTTTIDEVQCPVTTCEGMSQGDEWWEGTELIALLY